MTTLFDDGASSATFSLCRKYSYTLVRRWSDGPLLHFIMLNPSTADEVVNDPTVERCERRACMWHYGGLIVTNLFAWRSTDPAELRRVPDPVGPDNDEALVEAAHRAQLIVCAWGRDGALRGREGCCSQAPTYVQDAALPEAVGEDRRAISPALPAVQPEAKALEPDGE
jgi:hypothetical protein